MADTRLADPRPAEISENASLHNQAVSEKDDVERDSVREVVHEATSSVRPIHGWKWALVAVAINCGSFLYGLDNTIVADIQAAVVEDFGAVQKLSWLGSSFPLGSIALLLPLGKAFGLWDVKWLWLASTVVFQTGSAICGGAPNMNALIIGRVIAGAGGAGMYLGGLNLTAIFTSLEERPLYMALNGMVWGIGTILGPVIGGGFTESDATWRWGFYINLVIGAALAPVYLFLVPNFQPDQSRTFVAKLKAMDWLGTLLYAGIYATWIIALTFGGALWAWDDGRIIALFVVFGFALLTFSVTQTFSILTNKDMRIFPCELLTDRIMVLLHLLTSACGAAMFVPLYYIPLFFQFRGDGPVEAAVRLLPFVFLLVLFMLLNGGLMGKLNYYMPWYLFSGIFITIGGALMSTVDINTSTSAIYGYSILIAVGAGATSQSAYSIAPAKVPGQQIPNALSFMNIAQIGAIVISLTISGTLFQNLTYGYLDGPLSLAGFTSDEIHSVIAGKTSPLYRGLPDDLQSIVDLAIVRAISKLYYMVVAAGALMILCCIPIYKERIFVPPTPASEEPHEADP